MQGHCKGIANLASLEWPDNPPEPFESVLALAKAEDAVFPYGYGWHFLDAALAVILPSSIFSASGTCLRQLPLGFGCPPMGYNGQRVPLGISTASVLPSRVGQAAA